MKGLISKYAFFLRGLTLYVTQCVLGPQQCSCQNNGF